MGLSCTIRFSLTDTRTHDLDQLFGQVVTKGQARRRQDSVFHILGYRYRRARSSCPPVVRDQTDRQGRNMIDVSSHGAIGNRAVRDTCFPLISCTLRPKLVPCRVVNVERSERIPASRSAGTARSRACEFRHITETDAPSYGNRGPGSLPSCTRRGCLGSFAAALMGLDVRNAHAEQARPLQLTNASVCSDQAVPSILVLQHCARRKFVHVPIVVAVAVQLWHLSW